MPLDPARAKELFSTAVQISDAAERIAYLDRACDVEARQWVAALLWAHARPAGFRERPAAEPPSPADAASTGVYHLGATGEYRPDRIAGGEPADSVTESDGPPGAEPGGTGASAPTDVTGVYDNALEAVTKTYGTAVVGGGAAPPSEDETGAHGSELQAPTKTFGSDPAPAPAAPPRSTLIGGKYQITAVIGEGGMGAVYLAEQSEPVKRRVALKLIKRGADSRRVVARFEAERQALALMDHPNIARVYDGGTTPEGNPYFVMELVHGVPVTKFCDENRLSPKQRLELFVDVCRAVQHAHQKGIIHRDLKPGNILVTVVDGRPTPKVIDFGVAKAVDQQLTDESFGDEGAIVGTPAYMSPEQTDPTLADIDTRTDVYALGVILYELLTGSPPISPKSFRRGAILEMLRMVREAEPEHLSTKASSAEALPNIAASRGLEPAQLLRFLRGDVDWIVLKALEKDRERRYESANGLAADILRYLANEPVVARPPSRGYRFKKFVRRNRGPVTAAALVVLALVGGVTGVVAQWRKAVSERNQKETARAEAERNEKLALEQRKVALDTIGEISMTARAELANVPNSNKAKLALIEIADKRLDRIIRDPSVNISLNDTLPAVLHDFKGRALLLAGKEAEALGEYKRAAEGFETVLTRSADGAEKEVVKKNLVIELLMIGQLSRKAGDLAEAQRSFRRAGEVLEGVDDKASADYRRLLINVYREIGIGTSDVNPREALRRHRVELQVAEDLEQQEKRVMPTVSDETLRAVQQSASAVGYAENRVRNEKDAQAALDKALAIAVARQKAKPDDTERRHDLANIVERVGDAKLRSNNLKDAAERYRQAADLFQPIAEANKESDDALRDLGRILYSQGLVAARQKAGAVAAGYFRKSLDARRKRKTGVFAQRDLMMSLAQDDQHAEATKMAEAVRTQLPKDPGALVDIACCYAVCSTKVAATGAEQGGHDRYTAKAVEALKQAIDAGYGDKVNLETEPDLDGVRNLPEFQKLVKGVPEP